MGLKQDKELMDQLCEIERGLRDWEVKFVEDVAHQVHDRGTPLTPEQLKSALEIHDKFFG